MIIELFSNDSTSIRDVLGILNVYGSGATIRDIAEIYMWVLMEIYIFIMEQCGE